MPWDFHIQRVECSWCGHDLMTAHNIPLYEFDAEVLACTMCEDGECKRPAGNNDPESFTEPDRDFIT